MPTKEQVLESLGKDADRLAGLTDEQWDRYLDLVKWYLEGSVASDG